MPGASGSAGRVRERRELQRYYFVSDLHLGPDGAAPRTYDEAFAQWLAAVRDEDREAGSRSRLVLLGDLAELTAPAVWGRLGDAVEPARRLQLVLQSHPEVVQSLAEHLAGGWPVLVVPGNHDAELRSAEVQAELRQALGAPGSGTGLTFEPWIVHVPGMVYAEHGHQYHDINTFSSLLAPEEESDAELRVVLDRYRERLHRRRGPTGSALAVGRLATELTAGWVALAGTGTRLRRSAYRERVLPRYARSVDMDASTLQALDELAEVPPSRTARRLARKAVRAFTGPPDTDDYMVTAARGVHRVLLERGYDVPCYVFGHTHLPAARQVGLGGDGSPAMYLNTGTWSADVRGTDAPAPGAGTFVQVSRQDGRVQGQCRAWFPRRSPTSQRHVDDPVAGVR